MDNSKTSLTIECSYCGYEIIAEADRSGSRVECPYCRRQVSLPKTLLQKDARFGDYTIVKLLGAGGMGDVYLALQAPMGRPVALKILPPSMTQDRDTLDRFFNEMRMMAKFEHRNIVTAFQSGKLDQYYYLAMLYVDGEDLDVVLQRDGAIGEERALSICSKVAEALEYAWDKGQVLHRDIKPSNIMIDADGEVKLMDLGISKSLTDPNSGGQTSAGFVLGTPFYMSPEQARGRQDLDFRSDIYSLGATMYHMITGIEPYPGTEPLAIMTMHINEPLPSPLKHNPDISGPCVQLLELMMAKSPGERPASWLELRRCLDRVRAGQPPRKQREKFRGTPPAGPARSAAGPARSAAGGSVPRRRPATPTASRVVGPPKKRSGSSAPLVILVAALLLAAVFAIVAIKRSQQAPGLRRNQPTSGDRRQVSDPTTEALIEDPYAFLERALASTRAFAERNPDDLIAVQRRWERFASEARQTPYEDIAAAEVENARNRLLEDRHQAFQELRRQVQAMIAEDRLDDAIAAVRDYKGKYADQLGSQRQKLLTALDAHRQEANRREDLLKRARAAVDGIAAELLKQNFRRVEQLLRQLRQDPELVNALEPLSPLLGEIEATMKMPEVILETFERQTGKSTVVKFKDGTDLTIAVAGIDGNTIKADKVLKYGKMPYNFGLDDLSIVEKGKRLGRRVEPVLDIMRGLLSIESARLSDAERYFARADSELGELLRQRIALLAERQREAAAQELFGRLLAALDLPPEDLGDTWPENRPRPDEQQLAAVLSQLDGFAENYGETETGRAQVPKLQAMLKTLGNQQATVPAAKDDQQDGADLSKLTAAELTSRLARRLAQLNPTMGREDWQKSHFDKDWRNMITTAELYIQNIQDGSPITDLAELTELILRGEKDGRAAFSDLGFVAKLTKLAKFRCFSSSVRDITPLSQLPLEELWLPRALVADFTPLAGSKIQSLVINDNPVAALDFACKLPLTSIELRKTPVTSLEPLREIATLTRVAISHTKIESLTPLAGLQLTTLIADHSEVKRLEPLKDLPLRYLDVSYSPIRSFTVVKYLPLETFKAAGTEFDTLSLLKSAPLTELDVAGCPISNLANLENRGLLRLSVANTEIKRLDALAGMLLQELNISSTPVRDLTPLANAPLTVLLAARTGIEDLAPLAQAKLVELDLSGSPVKSLAPVTGMPLEDLKIVKTAITDLTPLLGAPLRRLQFDGYTPVRDDPILHQIPTLTWLNSQPYNRR